MGITSCDLESNVELAETFSSTEEPQVNKITVVLAFHIAKDFTMLRKEGFVEAVQKIVTAPSIENSANNVSFK